MNEKLQIIQRYFRSMWWILTDEWQCLRLRLCICVHVHALLHTLREDGRVRWLCMITHLDCCWTENLPHFFFCSSRKAVTWRELSIQSTLSLLLLWLSSLLIRSPAVTLTQSRAQRCWQNVLILLHLCSTLRMIWFLRCVIMLKHGSSVCHVYMRICVCIVWWARGWGC